MPTTCNVPECTTFFKNIDAIYSEKIKHLEYRLGDIDRKVDLVLHDIEDKIKERLDEHEVMIAEKSAKIAVKQAFGHLGVDVDDPKDLQEFRDDLRFGGVFRSAVTKGFFAVLAAVFGGIGLSLWMSFKEKIGLP